MGEKRPQRIIISILMLALFAISSIPTIPMASNTNPADTYPQGPSIASQQRGSASWSIAENILENIPAPAIEPPEKRVYEGLLEPSWVAEFTSKYSELLKSTYATCFGINMDNPIGILVKLGRLSLPELRSIAAEHGGVVAKYWRPIDTALVVVEGSPEKVRSLSLELASAGAARVSPDNVRQPAMWDSAAIFNMYNIWTSLGLDGSGVLVSVLDTGVDPNNPSIPDPDYWADFVNGDNTTAYDDHGHGTHVAGIILGRDHSLFPTGDAMWHAMLVGESSNFEPRVDAANLTYKIDVTGHDGETLTIKFQHLYILYEKYNAGYYYIYFKANASVWTSFDGTTWTKLAQYNGNQTSPVVESLSVTVPSGAATLFLRFSYDYLLRANGSDYDWSEWDIIGWFINNITILASGTPIYNDDVASTAMPPEVYDLNYWVRVEDRFRGMAPNASLAAAKVCGTTGCSDSAILQGMNWSLNIGANIVSMSLGGPATNYDALAEMADYLVDQGVLVVVAAGNEGPYYYNVSSPGISRKALTVAAATKQDTITSFSSPGPSPVGGWLKPDVAAIGYDIASSIPTDPGTTGIPWASDIPYAAWAGTSMATPMVSGLAALVKQAHPSWNATLIKQAIIASADWLRTNRYMSSQYDMYKQGAGLIDPHQAVTMTLVPLEANIWLGNHSVTSEDYINYTVRLLNTETAKAARVWVIEVGLYRILANGTDYSATVQDMSSLLLSPTVGDVLRVNAGSVRTLTISINLTNKTLPGGMYAGYILMLTNTSGIIKVIFSAKIAGAQMVEGYVFDYDTGLPIANATVYIYNSTSTGEPGDEIGNTTTGPDGYYMVSVPENVTYLFVGVDAASQGYFWHFSYTMRIPATGKLVYNASLLKMPSPGEIPAIIITDIDAVPSSALYNAINQIKSTAESLGLTPVLWDEYKLGRIVGPVVQGWMDLYAPITFYLAGGSYYPLIDPVDMLTLSWASNNSGTLFVVSSGDLGYAHQYMHTWLINVFHANYSKDLSPYDYGVDVYNVSSLSTLFGYNTFLANLGSPATTVIGTITVNGLTHYWPDEIVPENGGIAAGAWQSPAANYSIVLYLGGATQVMRTAYLSFELEQLDNETMQALIDRLIVLAIDYDPPFVTDYLPYRLENGVLIFEETGPAPHILEIHPLGYTIEVIDNATKTLLASASSPTLPIEVNLSAAGATPGSLLLVNLTVADRAGHLSKFSPATLVNYLEGSGGNFMISFAGPYNISVPGLGMDARLLVETGGRASVQLLRVPVDSVPLLPLWLSNHARYRQVIALDLYAINIDAGSLRSITMVFKIPSSVDVDRLSKTRIAYWNGTSWEAVSNYVIYASNMTVKIIINSTTKPSLGELGGTPIILSYPTPEVGGVLLNTPHESSTSTLPVLAAALAGLAIAAAARRRRE